MNIITTAKEATTKPKKFFEKKLPGIKNFKEPIKYLSALTLFATIFTTLYYFTTLNNISERIREITGIKTLIYIQPSIKNYIIIYLVASIILITLSFLRYWAVNITIKLWTKNIDYKKTYKTLAYSTTPGWLSAPFFVFFFFSIPITLIKGGIWWLITIISGIIFTGLSGYSMVLRSYALAKTYKISYFKAFLSIYVLGLILYLIMLLIIEIILLTPLIIILQ